MLYAGAGDLPRGAWRWPHFAPAEVACRHCGEIWLDAAALDALQAARAAVGRPFHILSGHRCPLHNARVGGAPLSEHKRIAFDIAAAGHDRAALLAACRAAGFRGTGFYTTFLHVDCGHPRWWAANERSRELWTS